MHQRESLIPMCDTYKRNIDSGVSDQKSEPQASAFNTVDESAQHRAPEQKSDLGFFNFHFTQK